MTLAAEYVEHLRRPRHNGLALAEALAAAALDVEARCVRAWSVREQAVDGITVAARPPTQPRPGERWFDPCDLSVNVCTGRGWLANRPVARWQLWGFLSVAERVRRPVQVEPPFEAFAPARLTPPGDELARCTAMTHGEATLFAWWLRKGLPHWLDWQLLASDHPALFEGFGLGREWCNGDSFDDAARIVIDSSTLACDPDETPAMNRGEYTREPTLGFRTYVLLQVGLLESVTSWHLNLEPVKLASLVDRTRF